MNVGSPARLPLFLVHGAIRSSQVFTELCKCLPADLPVYALQDASGLSAEDTFTEPTTLVDLAKAYVGEILKYVLSVKVCNIPVQETA
jgi:thioesterase domain-containing protein